MDRETLRVERWRARIVADIVTLAVLLDKHNDLMIFPFLIKLICTTRRSRGAYLGSWQGVGSNFRAPGLLILTVASEHTLLFCMCRSSFHQRLARIATC